MAEKTLETYTASELQKSIQIFEQIQGLMTKKALPSEQLNWIYGYPLNGNVGMFTEYVEDVVSDLASGDDPFGSWIPMEMTDYLFENSAHLSFIIPENFDGSATYMAHLLDQDDIAECDYGTGADYQVWEFQDKIFRQSFSTKNRPMSILNGLGLHKTDKRKFLRGARAGYDISTEGEWSLALLTENIETHNSWDIIWGNPYASSDSNKNMTEGLDQKLRVGYVKNHLIGKGDPVFCDPIVKNMLNIDDPVVQLRMIMAYVGKIIQRMVDRGYRPKPGDIGLFMTANHWKIYSEVLAAGALTRLYSSTTTLQVTPEAVQRELERVRNAGGIDVMGVFVPVYVNNNLGKNMPLADGSGFGTIGDVYFLTRTYRGMNVLKQRALNWDSSKLTPPPEPQNTVRLPINMLGGILRTGYAYTTLTEQCWYYWAELYKGLHCSMMPLQGKFLSLIVPADLENEIEATDFTHENFYAYDGELGGQGVSLLQGLGAT